MDPTRTCIVDLLLPNHPRQLTCRLWTIRSAMLTVVERMFEGRYISWVRRQSLALLVSTTMAALFQNNAEMIRHSINKLYDSDFNQARPQNK